MIFGKYGTMILENMEKNYPYRKKELELKGELDIKILQREKYILELKKEVEEKIKKEHQVPNTHEISILAKYQQMIDGLVDEVLMKEIMLNVWIGNLGKYNEGELVGEWLELPVSKKELDTFLREKVGLQLTQEEVERSLAENGVCYEEYMINDYETDLPIQISEYENLDNLNLLATIAENVNDMDAINAYVDSQGKMTIEELANLMEQEDNIAYYRFSNDNLFMSSEEKMGYEMAEITGLLDTLQKMQIEDFFDFEGYGRSWENGDITILDEGYIDFGDCDVDLRRYTLEELKEQYNLEDIKKLKIVFKEVGKDPVVMEIDDTLEAKQKLVGGLIEVVPYKDDLLLICNEEGKIANLKPNLQFDYDYIAGNCFIVGDDFENSGFKSVEESQIEGIKKDLENRTIILEEIEETDDMEF